MKKMKRFSAALLALGLGTSTLFTQLPVRATEKIFEIIYLGGSV